MLIYSPHVFLPLKVPKSVGRTDDAFQKCRSRSLNATIEEVKLAELFDVSGHLTACTFCKSIVTGGGGGGVLVVGNL